MVRLDKRKAIALAVGASLLSLVILAVDPTTARAQTSFNGFGPSFQYDQGLNPSVAVFNGTVVEVRNGTGGAGPLLYQVGTLNGSTITWSGSHQYDNNGFNPSVAMVGTTVVEVHNGGAGPGSLWYRVGTLNGTTVSWNNSQQYDNGFNPSIAMTGNTVVEVHNGGAGPGALWYRLGTLNGTSINWNVSYKFDSYSTNPSVAVNSACYFCNLEVLEVHNDNGSPGPLWYRIGNIVYTDSTPTISWQNPEIYDNGWNPKIAWAGNLVLEVHNGQAGTGPTLYHNGTLLGPPIQYDNGNNPSVAIDPIGFLTAIEVHNGGNGLGPEWYHVGTSGPPK